jgi:hypothetical protein
MPPVTKPHAGLGQLGQPGHDAVGRTVLRGQRSGHLVGDGRAGRGLVDEHAIGGRTADIDPDVEHAASQRLLNDLSKPLR